MEASRKSGSGSKDFGVVVAHDMAQYHTKVDTFEKLAHILAEQVRVCCNNFTEYEKRLTELTSELKETKLETKDYEQRLLLKVS